MSVELISDQEFLEIAEVINDQNKKYYSSYPEFTPLEFEQFCVKLLNIKGYKITSHNNKIMADGGIDFEAEKDGVLIIGQCKKSDSRSQETTNIGEPSVMQHYGIIRKK